MLNDGKAHEKLLCYKRGIEWGHIVMRRAVLELYRDSRTFIWKLPLRVLPRNSIGILQGLLLKVEPSLRINASEAPHSKHIPQACCGSLRSKQLVDANVLPAGFNSLHSRWCLCDSPHPVVCASFYLIITWLADMLHEVRRPQKSSLWLRRRCRRVFAGLYVQFLTDLATCWVCTAGERRVRDRCIVMATRMQSSSLRRRWRGNMRLLTIECTQPLQSEC